VTHALFSVLCLGGRIAKNGGVQSSRNRVAAWAFGFGLRLAWLFMKGTCYKGELYERPEKEGNCDDAQDNAERFKVYLMHKDAETSNQ
jgi:hypothetical protein